MGKKLDNCPHCGKDHCIEERAFLNVDSYGSSTFKMKCVHCHKKIRVSLSRIVVINSVEKSNHKNDEASY